MYIVVSMWYPHFRYAWIALVCVDTTRYGLVIGTRETEMTYQIAVSAAEMDAECYSGAIAITQNADARCVELRVNGVLCGSYPYRD